jgi:hypothetical protein
MFEVISYIDDNDNLHNCNYIVKNLKTIQLKNPSINIKYYHYRYIPEWEFLQGLA